jgi:hypothetical protein
VTPSASTAEILPFAGDWSAFGYFGTQAQTR